MRDTFYNLICNDRNNKTQRISIGITKHFSKPREKLNDKDLVDPITDVIYRKDQCQFQLIKEFLMKIKMINAFYMQLQYLLIMKKFIESTEIEYLKIY